MMYNRKVEVDGDPLVNNFMNKLIGIFLLVVLAGCGNIKLTTTLGEQRNEQSRIAMRKIIFEGEKDLPVSAPGGVDLAIEIEPIVEDEDIGDEVRMYCNEEEKPSDWCLDGYIKYAKNLERGCWESYCKEKPKILVGASGSVAEVQGGVKLAQPQVRLELSFEDLEDVDMSVLTIDQIEEFGRVKLKTNKGDMMFRLFPTVRPATVRNFVKLADGGYLRDLSLYRVIPNFLVQFGDGFGTKKDSDIDFDFGDVRRKGLINKKGTLAFAELDLTTFFINLTLNYDLDEEFVPFGEIVKGEEILDDIAAVRTDGDDTPVDPLIVSMIEIDEVYEEFLKREIK